MTNYERLMASKDPEAFTYVYQRLHEYALYAGRLLNSSPDDFLEWLNKESDSIDDILFDMELKKCHRCGRMPTLLSHPDRTYKYVCPFCNTMKNTYPYPHYSELSARLEWNY